MKSVLYLPLCAFVEDFANPYFYTQAWTQAPFKMVVSVSVVSMVFIWGVVLDSVY